MTICATPALPLPARAVDGHLMTELVPSVHALPAASTRNLEKFEVVPEESERTARVIEVLGRLTDSDLAIMGRHVKYGERTLEWFIHEFVTQHLKDHVVQLKAEMEAVR